MLKMVAIASALVLGMGSAYAQSSATTGSKPGMRMTSAQCQSLWNRADAGKSGSLSRTQAQPYVTDFKRADTNNDGKLSSSEFTSACQAGLTKDTASTGASSGSAGMKSGAKSSK